MRRCPPRAEPVGVLKRKAGRRRNVPGVAAEVSRIGVFEPSAMREAAVAAATKMYRRRLEVCDARRAAAEAAAKARFREGAARLHGKPRIDGETALFCELASSFVEHVVEVSLASAGYEQSVCAAHTMSAMMSGSVDTYGCGDVSSGAGGIPEAGRVLSGALNEALAAFRVRLSSAEATYFGEPGRGQAAADRCRGAVEAARVEAVDTVHTALAAYGDTLAGLWAETV